MALAISVRIPTLTSPFLRLPNTLTCPTRRCAKWIKAGVLTAYQFQGEWRIRKADAVVFVERARFQV
jgi:hypothetical protein